MIYSSWFIILSANTLSLAATNDLGTKFQGTQFLQLSWLTGKPRKIREIKGLNYVLNAATFIRENKIVKSFQMAIQQNLDSSKISSYMQDTPFASPVYVW